MNEPGPSLQVPCAHGVPPVTGRMRSAPEDFQVREVLGFEPDGAGAHVVLEVEKRDANTGWVAAHLARHAGVAAREVGYSGHKDRHALTRQAFSVPLPPAVLAETCLEWAGDGYRVIAAGRHGRKLRPGSHRANEFELRLRDVAGAQTALETRLQRIAVAGVPNYFGPQRFGRDGGNLRRALAWAGGGAGPRERSQRSFMLSAARGFLFNSVLAARVARADWDRIVPGEAVMLDGRRSYFTVTDVDAVTEQRCRELDIHPSGPLPGRGAAPVTRVAAEIEDATLVSHESLIALLAREGLEHERRSLRLPVRQMSWHREADTSLVLKFTLPRGTFATAVLHEVLAEAWDATEGNDD